MITIFTGAGASKPLGYPTTPEFFAVGKGMDLQENDVYGMVKGHLKKDILDVEDVLQFLSPLSRIDSTPLWEVISPHVTGDWIPAIPEFVRRTEDACFDHYGRHPTSDDVERLYGPLLRWCGWNLKLFTTNYDPVTDAIMKIVEGIGIPSYDGFNKHGDWCPRSFPSLLRKGGVAIYRLHGSMSWVEVNGQVRNTRDYSRRVRGYAKHVIIFPGFKGDQEQVGNPAVRFAHDELSKELEATSLVIVIGFSFRDPQINRVFGEALSRNKSLNVIVWNPSLPEGLTELKGRYDDRIYHLKRKFGDNEAFYELQHLVPYPSMGIGCETSGFSLRHLLTRLVKRR